MDYIQSTHKPESCVFCVVQSLEDGVANWIVHRGRYAYVILNRYPYTSGHLMVVPYQHQPTLNLLDNDTRSEMMELASQSTIVIQDVYNPQGFNIGINMGEAAGAGIVGHVHLHVVPRWVGDTNFMSSLGMTRVLPETLEDTLSRLTKAWKSA
jgi:ATP adenylyltransferase